MATPKHNGIKKVEYQDAGGAGYTEVTKLVAEESAVSQPDADSVDNPTGSTYYGGTMPGADTEQDIRVTYMDDTTEVFTGLAKVRRRDVQGKAGGRVGYQINVTTFSTTPAV